MNPELAARFALEWIEAWNAHDIDRILSHYSEDIEMSSPVVARVAGVPGGRLQGKQAVRAYWAKALALYPNLGFLHVCTMVGVDGLVIHYIGAAGRRVAEVLRFDREGLVTHAQACYEVMSASGNDAGDS
ncbi:MAG: nuclear transport factor 2 family protein [Ideonella sp.]|nr:nuclear transport factor 2 family protein [Ideonella sp.]